MTTHVPEKVSNNKGSRDEKKLLTFEMRTMETELAESMLKVIVNNAGDLVVSLNNWLEDMLNDNRDRASLITEVGIACLVIFQQVNWTGPSLDLHSEVLREILQSSEIANAALSSLEKDGNEVYQLLAHPVLLLIAKVILIDSMDMVKTYENVSVWLLRCVFAYVGVSTEIAEHHSKMLNTVVEFCDENKLHLTSKELQAEYYLIASHLYLKFYNFVKCQECHAKVQDLLKIDIALTSSLGKRTKFQQFDLPQMRLGVTINEEREKPDSRTSMDLPNDVVLDEETLLPHVKFIDEKSIKVTTLTPIDQAFILSACTYLQKSRARDKLTQEEVIPYVESVLVTPQTWSIQFKSLYMRCVLEYTNSRKIERAIAQLEALIETRQKENPQAYERQLHMHCVGLEPLWAVEKSLAQLFFTMGCTDSALEIFLRLHLWDDAIFCYQRQGKHGKAEKLIREQLAIRETTALWCLLGDATMDMQYYEKAWEFSKHRSARAQRSIGLIHLRKNEFSQAIPYLQESLNLNCLQPGIAFSLGCSCMAANKLEQAQRALQQCVSTDPDNGQAWCNLSSCFIRLNKLPKAYKALQEAARLSYDNWKIWENFFLVATDLGAFEDAINCCHRLIDLNRKTIDTDVLKILVEVVISGLEDFRGVSARRLKDRLLKLFGHVTSKITGNPYIYESYAKLVRFEASTSEKEKALQLLYKSHRCFTQHTDWERSENELGAVLRVTRKMIEVTKEVCITMESPSRCISLYSTTKMCISNLIIRLKKAFCDDTNQPLKLIVPFIEELDTNLLELETLLQATM